MTEFYESGGKAHPIRNSEGYSTIKSGERQQSAVRKSTLRRKKVPTDTGEHRQRTTEEQRREIDKHELMEDWQVSRTAVGHKRYDRMQWTANQYHKDHPEVSKIAAYKALDYWLN